MFLILSIFTPIAIIYSIVGMITDIAHWRKYFPLVVISFFMIGYSYLPGMENDLSRYISMVEWSKYYSNPIDYYLVESDGLIVKSTLIWLVGKLNDPRILPALSLCITYSIMIFITLDYSEIHNSQNRVLIILGIQFLLMPAIFVMEYFRSPIAFALVILAVYLEEGKKIKMRNTIPLYIVACLLHFGAIIIVLANLLVKYKKSYTLVALFSVLLTFVLVGIISYYLKLNFITDYYKLILRKLGSYFLNTEETEWEKFTRTNKLYITYKVLVLVICVCIFIITLNNIQLDSINRFAFYTVVVVFISSFISGNIYMRFFIGEIIILGPILVDDYIVALEQHPNIKITEMPILIFVILGGSLFVTIWQLLIDRLSFQLSDFLSVLIKDNIYTVTLNCIKSLL